MAGASPIIRRSARTPQNSATSRPQVAAGMARIPSGRFSIGSCEDQPKRKPVLVTVPNLYFRGDGTDIPFELRKGRQEFTWGYALTVHKSQGSQWQSVLIRDESRLFGEHRRKPLYTALTRAPHRVVVVR